MNFGDVFPGNDFGASCHAHDGVGDGGGDGGGSGGGGVGGTANSMVMVLCQNTFSGGCGGWAVAAAEVAIRAVAVLRVAKFWDVMLTICARKD